MIPDYPIDDNLLIVQEVYAENVDLNGLPPGSEWGRKLLRAQTDSKQNGVYEVMDTGAGAVWTRRLCPSGMLYLWVGAGVDVGRNVGAGPAYIDGRGLTWGADAVAVGTGHPSPP